MLFEYECVQGGEDKKVCSQKIFITAHFYEKHIFFVKHTFFYKTYIFSWLTLFSIVDILLEHRRCGINTLRLYDTERIT